MGERGKDEPMKNRNTNLERMDPIADKAEGPSARPGTAHKAEARLGREVQARIGQQLRAMYNDIVNQGVPDHLANLVRRLGEQDQD